MLCRFRFFSFSRAQALARCIRAAIQLSSLASCSPDFFYRSSCNDDDDDDKNNAIINDNQNTRSLFPHCTHNGTTKIHTLAIRSCTSWHNAHCIHKWLLLLFVLL